MPATIRNARRSRLRSAGVKERKRRALDIVYNVDEVVFSEFLEEGDEVVFAAFSFYVVLFKECITDLPYRSRRLNELPDSSADGIEPLIDAVFEVEDRRLVAKIC